MKNEVLIRSSLIPKKVFAIWRRFFGFRLKHFSMAGDTAFYAFKERIQQELFRNIFCFLIITGLWVKPFLILGRTFQILVNIAFYVSGDIGGKNNFFKIPKTPFLLETGQKNLSIFYQNFLGTTLKNALFPSRLTLSTKWLLGKTFIFDVFFRF